MATHSMLALQVSPLLLCTVVLTAGPLRLAAQLLLCNGCISAGILCLSRISSKVSPGLQVCPQDVMAAFDNR